MKESRTPWLDMEDIDDRILVDFRAEFFHDAYIRELGEAVENSRAYEDNDQLKELEYRLKQSLDKENEELFIRFMDTHRLQFMRAEGESYIKGYFMGVEAGRILEKYERGR
ncbi:MAG: hypothetical protein HFI90_04695 [Clostridia bacterium]|nr:hypothetical protein [Clostridia bacterium]